MRLADSLQARIWKELLDRILTGRLSIGQRLPSEKELQVIYSASRTPVRQALDRLASEGLIVRLPGRGTFVSKIPPGSPVATLSSFSHYYQNYLKDISAQTIRVEVKPPLPQIAQELRMEATQPTTHFERVRFFKEKPVAYLKHILPPQFSAEPARKDPTFMSMVLFMREKYAIRCTQAKEEVDAIMPSPEERRVMELKDGHRAVILPASIALCPDIFSF